MARATVSDDLDYETWAPVAKATLTEEGLWDVVENGIPTDPTKVPELAATIQPEELSQWRDLVRKDTEALKLLQSSLPDLAFRKTLSASAAKELWDLLRKGNQESNLRSTRLEKKLDEVSMHEGETLDLFLDRVLEIVGELRRMKIVKSDYEVITKVLSSLSGGYGDVAILFDELKFTKDMKSMPLTGLVEFVYMYESITNEATSLRLKNLRLESKSDKWCSVCNKSNHNQEECTTSISRAKQPRPRKSDCFLCGERGHYARDCTNKHVDYVMAAVMSKSDLSYDEDLWMVSGLSTIHMTPYEKVFTALDRTHKAKVALVDGKFLMAQGKGDVKVVMKGGKKKTITNVLFVPGMMRNVLSLSQMEVKGCSFREIGRGECIISDETGAVFGETMWDGKDLALRLEVVRGNLTS